MSIAFDTHRFVKKLTRGGFTEEQAETLAEEQIALLNANLATKADIEAVKADIEALRHETKTDLAKVEAGLRAEIAKVDKRIESVRADLLKWMFAGLIAQGGVVVALLQLFK